MAPQIPSVLAAVSAPCSPALGALSMPGTMAPLPSKALWWALSWECCSIPCTWGERFLGSCRQVDAEGLGSSSCPARGVPQPGWAGCSTVLCSACSWLRFQCLARGKQSSQFLWG